MQFIWSLRYFKEFNKQLYQFSVSTCKSKYLWKFFSAVEEMLPVDNIIGGYRKYSDLLAVQKKYSRPQMHSPGNQTWTANSSTIKRNWIT